MKLKISIILIALLLGIQFYTSTSCKQRQVNPNGSSELAVLMRDMQDDAWKLRKQVQNGSRLKSSINPALLTTVEPTEAGKNQSTEYISFSSAYTMALSNLESAEKNDIQMFYNATVNACINCHKSMCPGPVKAIKKLYLESL